MMRSRAAVTFGVAKLVLAGVLASGATAGAAQSLPEPTAAHPRLFAEPEVTSALADLARQRGSFVARTVERCRTIGDEPMRFQIDGYMGLDWGQYLQACLIAYRATGDERFGRTALVYFKALIDDLKTVGDGAGGDASARRDSGFAMRALGPNSALAYDWLHDFLGVDEALRARARQRFKAWTDWYLDNGYRARSPGTNYQAGYLFGATLIAVAQAGEGGTDSARLWQHVVDTLYLRDLLPAMRDDGVLVGGDWGEGWQYGPLSVAEYALGARALQRFGLDVGVVGEWLESVVVRHVYGLVPGGRALTFAVGDTQAEEANIEVRPETLAAVVAGPATERARGWAEAEMRRLRLYEAGDGFPLFRALAEAARVTPVEIPRDGWPHYYVAKGTGALYARFDWADTGAWFTALCSAVRDVDHMHPNAGNFVLSRGADDVIVDPSPYGTLSSLTSNAPTVESNGLPPDYVPSQAYWGGGTGFEWIRSVPGSGLLAARCNYAPQYRIQDRPSDVPFAQRDFVALPSDDGRDVVLLVVDRATTPAANRGLHLRFRTVADLKQSAEGYAASIGSTRTQIMPLRTSMGTAELRRLPGSSCFVDGYTRGNCDAARFPIAEYRTRLEGQNPMAIHAVTATGSASPDIGIVNDGDLSRVTVGIGERRTEIVVGKGAGRTFSLPAREAMVMLLDEPANRTVTARAAAGGCEIAVSDAASGDDAGGAFIAMLGPTCALTPAE